MVKFDFVKHCNVFFFGWSMLLLGNWHPLSSLMMPAIVLLRADNSWKMEEKLTPKTFDKNPFEEDIKASRPACSQTLFCFPRPRRQHKASGVLVVCAVDPRRRRGRRRSNLVFPP